MDEEKQIMELDDEFFKFYHSKYNQNIFGQPKKMDIWEIHDFLSGFLGKQMPSGEKNRIWRYFKDQYDMRKMLKE